MIEHFRKLSLEEIAEELAKPKATFILFHVRSDADAVGSAFALRELLRVMGVPVYCACSDEIPERLNFLVDGVQGSVLLGEDVIFDHERVVSVDSASPSQLGPLFSRLHKDVDIMIDHHAVGGVYADNYIDPTAAATGEIIYELAQILQRKGYIEQIPPRTLACIYAAVSEDTGSFRYSNTTPKTLRIAAELMESGVDTAMINSLLYDSKSFIQLKAEGEAMNSLSLYFDGRVASVLFPYALKKRLDAEDEHLETLIDVARSVSGVEVAFVVKQSNEEPTFRVSMRSKEEVDVSAICARFGGGGHKRAAGCTIEASSAEQAEKMVLAEISKRI